MQKGYKDEPLFKEKLDFIKSLQNCYAVAPTDEEYVLARDFETVSKYAISFYDCLHMAICLKRRFILVTRDKKLLVFAKKYLIAEKPENLHIIAYTIIVMIIIS
ncbi:MAG: PIN domain-containing protein [Nanoarchaeota archaeon]|nr:PIN domain-containing protein [Nanoarchaeota archaeon]